ncbi:cTAGE family member 5 isoform X3 [Pelobates cultripes]|uniref:CTAGE family member 5 isoform X3 n=1 Tax=Pelobates cultripes TaxID=61616 RepID=A0AAD1TPB7_PELCU|nr:cTAGE family member 5 isoform X3 [Pelobates cultripes]
MAQRRIFALLALCIAQIHSQKILSEKKKCGDPQCESLMIRAQANQDYVGPDCRYLSFKMGAEVNVYYKLSGKREDLWQGSTGKAYGLFSKDAVNIEEIYITEEYEVPAQEIDFVCLNGGEYIFENEDSVLHKNRENEYMEITFDLNETEDGIKTHSDDHVNRDQEVDPSLQTSDQEPEKAVPAEKQSWGPSGFARWLGFKKDQETVKETMQMDTEPREDDTFRTRRIAASEEQDVKGLDDAQTETSGWFSGRIRRFLPFGQKDSNSGERSTTDEVNDMKQDDNVADTGMGDEEKQIETSEPHEAPSKWLNFGFDNVLGLDEKNDAMKPEAEQKIDDSTKNESPEVLNQDDSSRPTHSMQGESTDNLVINEIQEDPSKINNDLTQVDIPKTLEDYVDLDASIGGVNPIEETELLTGHSDKQTVSNKLETPNDFQDEKISKLHQEDTEIGEADASMLNLNLLKENTLFQGQKSDTDTEEPSDDGFFSFYDGIRLWDMAYSSLLEIHSSYVSPALSLMTDSVDKVVSSLPDDLQPGSDFYGCSWEVVISTAVLGFLSLLMFTCRTVRSVKSRCYYSREHKLGDKIVEALKEKSEVLEKLSVVQKQYEEIQESLQDSSQQKLIAEISDQKVLVETLQDSNSALEENLSKIEEELENEKRLGSELQDAVSGLNEKIRDLEEKFKKEKSQKEQIRTTLKVFEINQGRLETSLQDSLEEKSHLQESIKQLSKEAEGWEERFSELSENSRMLISSVEVMQQDLSNKQSQIKSLIDSLLKMKDWSSEVDDANEADDNTALDIKWDFENGEPLGDPQKRTIQKLIHAAMLNASLRSVESEKQQIYENLSDEVKAKEQLQECINNLQNSKQTLSTDNKCLESEMEMLKQKISVMSEMYQENETKLHRKLTVQENERMQKEEKLSKMDEKVNLAAGELVNIKTRVKELEEEIEKTVCSYQSQVSSYEKKSHDNWLTAREAERHLSDLKKETAHLRQKLTEAEYKVELIERDPNALDVFHTIGRESSPYGHSYFSRLHESRTFLSPPTLLEGPLRISPMLPGADRGSRSPGYYPAFHSREQRDVNAERKADHQRTLSDAGSLSPPWDREQKASLPPPEPLFQHRRPERLYHYPAPSGRFSGPAELTRNQGKPFHDSTDGQSSPEYKSSRNGSEENENLRALPRPPMEGEAMEMTHSVYTGHPPLMRMPLLPMDPRGAFFRRPFPMPPPPMEMFGPPPYHGMSPIPPLHAAMRSPMPVPHYPPFPVHGDQQFPPQHVRPMSRSDLPPANAAAVHAPPASESVPEPLPENKT